MEDTPNFCKLPRIYISSTKALLAKSSRWIKIKMGILFLNRFHFVQAFQFHIFLSASVSIRWKCMLENQIYIFCVKSQTVMLYRDTDIAMWLSIANGDSITIAICVLLEIPHRHQRHLFSPKAWLFTYKESWKPKGSRCIALTWIMIQPRS